MAFWEDIPIVNTIGDAATGKWSDFGKNWLTGGLYGTGRAVANKVGGVYDQKRAGYDAVMQQAAVDKQDRINRMNDTYARANAQLDPSRAALKSLYGDPSTWKI